MYEFIEVHISDPEYTHSWGEQEWVGVCMYEFMDMWNSMPFPKGLKAALKHYTVKKILIWGSN